MIRVKPSIHERHLRNPGMGMIRYYYGEEGPLPDLADVLFVTLTWAEVEKSPGQYEFVAGWLKQALELAEKHDRMVAVRIVGSYQNTPMPIPKYLVDQGVKLIPKPQEKNDPLLAKSHNVDFFEPEWWNPIYIEAHRKMVEAYGKALDGHPRLAYVDMRYYGYWGEGHRFGAEVPWPADIDKREWCKARIDDFMAAFRKTPLVVETACDENTPYPGGTAIDYAVERGAWMRRDGFGNYVSKEESKFLKAEWKRSLMIAENSQYLTDFLAGDVRKWWDKNAPPTSIDDLFNEILDHHVNYFPLGWTRGEYDAVERERPDLWRKASLKTGYRMIVTETSWPKAWRRKGPLVVETTWRNTGVGRLPFRYAPTLYLLNDAGAVAAKAMAIEADPMGWYENEDQSLRFTLPAADRIEPGAYKIAVGMEDEDGQPVVRLGMEGEADQKRFALGEIKLE